ncbi:MAG: hypothetical protein L0Y80_04955 [Ignavibacteriae bacterium]|nr:hypothetical protein [Ignavibacteriota bacterium]
MRRFLLTLTFLALPVILLAQAKKDEQPKSTNLRQYYSGKFGIYKPSDGLNNGLMFGVDGITEFIHYDFFISGAAELYLKQTFNIYKNAPPSGYSQAMFLIPLHANVGYQVFNVGDADSRGYIGAGLGYYLYFYSVEYSEGGGIFNPLANRSESKNGGNLFATVFFRVLIGQIFLEPRVYFAAKEEDGLPGGYNYVVNPSGFAVTLGFQYH